MLVTSRQFANISANGSTAGYVVPGKGTVTLARFFGAGTGSTITSGIIAFAGARKAGDPSTFVTRAVSPGVTWTGPGTAPGGVGEQSLSLPVLAGESVGMFWTNGSLNLYQDSTFGAYSEYANSATAPSVGQETPVTNDPGFGPIQVQFVVDLAPANTALPSIGGGSAPVVGQPLTANPGTWNSSPTGYAYQWWSCAADGTACAPISGATLQSYTPGAADAGRTLRVQVVASNATGGNSDPVDSPASAGVAGAPSPPSPGTSGNGVSPPAPNTPPQPKVTLCHSGNGKNFTTITVAPEAAIDGHAKNHDDDIIPPFDYVKNGKTLQYAGQNWNAAGRAILNAGCQTPASNPANNVFNPPPPPGG
ncbi:MAG: hypothetical protein ACKOH7_07505 [Solirubrobacterales bacterium]